MNTNKEGCKSQECSSWKRRKVFIEKLKSHRFVVLSNVQGKFFHLCERTERQLGQFITCRRQCETQAIRKVFDTKKRVKSSSNTCTERSSPLRSSKEMEISFVPSWKASQWILINTCVIWRDFFHFNRALLFNIYSFLMFYLSSV